MRTKRKTRRPGSPNEKLKKQVTTLRNQVKQLTDERNQYLRVVHAWAKEKISASELQKWMNDTDEEGGSLLDLIATLQKKP
jgi:flagellar biosynthesis chaperone FliJ